MTINLWILLITILLIIVILIYGYLAQKPDKKSITYTQTLKELPSISDLTKYCDCTIYKITVGQTWMKESIGDLLVFEKKCVTVEVASVTHACYTPDFYNNSNREDREPTPDLSVLEVIVIEGNLDFLEVGDEYEYIQKPIQEETEEQKKERIENIKNELGDMLVGYQDQKLDLNRINNKSKKHRTKRST